MIAWCFFPFTKLSYTIEVNIGDQNYKEKVLTLEAFGDLIKKKSIDN